ncbi:MAG TPA: creatininase [Solirubrobacteraceae bacterium]|nr:creatininase [Solirubrobacteraceae bacterium]
MLRTRKLAHLTWPEVAEAANAGTGVIVPVGAVEQHGLHLPLITDALLAADLAHAVAEATDMVVAPTLSYGYRSRPLSGGGQGFPGTTSLSATTLMAMLEDVLREYVRHGFERLVVLNWHFENRHFIYEAAYRALLPHETAAARIMVLERSFEELSPATLELLFPDGFPGWATEHAAIFETSLMQYLHPELVLEDRIVDDAAERSPWWDVVPTPEDFVPETGALWKASQATPEKGAAAWHEIVTQVTGAIAQELGVPALQRP